MGFVRWIIGFLIAVIVVLFAVSNRHLTEVYPSPFHAPIELPLYLIGLVILGFGFLLGVITSWLNGAPVRHIKRKQKKHIRELEKALETAEEEKKINSPPSDFFPSLPKKR